MELNLKRPVVFFDLETTESNITRDRIVEISIIKVWPDGHELERTRRINPEMPIPAEATAVHHITDADVASEPTFRQLAKSLAEIFHDSDIAGFNSNLSGAYKFYCGKDLEDAHSACADTRATYEVLKAQLDHYPDLKNTVPELSEYSSHTRNVDLAGRLIYDDNRREIINFGKYKGQPAEEVLRNDSGYYGWIMSGDFPQNTKDAFALINLRIKTAKPH